MLLLNSLSKRYVSRAGLDIVEKPDQYFNNLALVSGMITYKGITYNIKKIQLDEEIKPSCLPEVQFIETNSKCPYLLKCIDYIIEQEEQDGAWEDRAVYILMENSDYDLRSYVNKHGQLCLEDLLSLCECLFNANYHMQKHLKMSHGDIKPQNVRVIVNQNKRPVFKLSFFEDSHVPKAHRMCRGKDTLAYMAPELLCSSVISNKYSLQESIYNPSQELQTLITECPNEIRYDPSRADVFSAGLTIFSAATNMFFRLAMLGNTLEVPRDGQKEIFLMNQNLKLMKNQYQCEGLIEILRVMLTHNPMVRYDFEELASRVNKINARDSRIPRVKILEYDQNLQEEHRILKGKFLELQSYTIKMREREIEFQNIINQLREQLDYQFEEGGVETRKTLDIEEQPIEILNDMSSIASILEENSFLSPTLRKPETPGLQEKKYDFSDTRTNSKNMESSDIKEAKECLVAKRQPSYSEPSEQQKVVRPKKFSQGQLTHLEIKNSIIRRREISDTTMRVPS